MLGVKDKKAQTVEVERVEDHPELARELERLAEVQTKRGEVTEEINRVQRGLSAIANQGRPVDRLTLAAEQMLSGDDLSGSPEAEGLRKELSALYQRRAILERACEIQRRRVDDLRAQLTREMFEDFGRDEFAAEARLLALAGAEYGRAVERFLSAQDAAERRGFSWHTLAAIPPHKVLRLRLFEPSAAKAERLEYADLGQLGFLILWAVREGALSEAEGRKVLGKPFRV